MRVPLKLKGRDLHGRTFEETTETINVSASGFLCECKATLWEGASVEVFLLGQEDRYAGSARVARIESDGDARRSYGFHFRDVPTEWVLRSV